MKSLIIVFLTILSMKAFSSQYSLECNEAAITKTESNASLTDQQNKNFKILKSIGLSDIDETLFLIFDSMKNHAEDINAQPSVDDPNRISILIERVNSIFVSQADMQLKRSELAEILRTFQKIENANIDNIDLIRILNLYSIYKLNTLEIRTVLENKLCGLSNNEIFSIYLYTGGAYKPINEALRNKNKDFLQFSALIETINSGLEKLKPFLGVTDRGANLSEKALEQHRVGNKVTYPAFTSASRVRGFESDYEFKLTSKNGRYIAPLSIHPDEEEVLFKNNTSFVVDSQTSYTFFMTEQ